MKPLADFHCNDLQLECCLVLPRQTCLLRLLSEAPVHARVLRQEPVIFRAAESALARFLALAKPASDRTYQTATKAPRPARPRTRSSVRTRSRSRSKSRSGASLSGTAAPPYAPPGSRTPPAGSKGVKEELIAAVVGAGFHESWARVRRNDISAHMTTFRRQEVLFSSLWFCSNDVVSHHHSFARLTDQEDNAHAEIGLVTIRTA